MTQPSTPQNLLRQGKAVSSEADDAFKIPIRVVAAACCTEHLLGGQEKWRPK